MASSDPVVFNLDGDSVVFQQGFGPVRLDARDGGETPGRVVPTGATLSDPDSADFDGGSLSVTVTANATPGEDVLSFDASLVTLSGGDTAPDAGETVTVDGVVIGVIAPGGDGKDGNPLEVTFGADATLERVETLLGALVYENNSATPSTLPRGVSITLTDGDGGTSDAHAVTVNVQTPQSGAFVDSGQSFATSRVHDLVLGDVDGDGDIDLVFNQPYAPTRVWLNDGDANFTDSGQTIAADMSTPTFALGDVDGDGDLDMVLASAWAEPAQVWFNTNGTFTYDPTAWIGDTEFTDITLGDVDGDGDLDLVATDLHYAGVVEVWRNDGTGVFTDTEQEIDALATRGNHALGDLDGDGDLDIAVATYGSDTANQIFLNDGSGTYAATAQAFGDFDFEDVALADVDGDGDLDVIMTTDVMGIGTDGARIFLNDGHAQFTDSGQVLGNESSARVVVGDIDGDGDQDLIFGSDAISLAEGRDQIFLNDGTGIFYEGFQHFTPAHYGTTYGLALADLDSDGDLDLAVGYNASGDDSGIFLNEYSDEDYIFGTQADDTFSGGPGDDTILGNGGNDWLDGGEDDDALSGGDGDDTLIGGAGDDLIDGETGTDTVMFTGAADTNVDLRVAGTQSTGHGDDILTDIENVTTGDGNDVITGNNGANVFTSGAGDDTLRGGGGDDVLNGGDGLDSLDGGNGNDTLDGGVGDDTLDGGTGDDVLNGGAGDDTLKGGEGDDTLNGGDGDDVIFVTAGTHLVDGGDGHDILDSTGREEGVAYSTNFTNIEEIRSPDIETSANWSEVSTGLIYHGGDDRDSVLAGSGADWIDGAKGADDLAGGDGDDVLLGGAGRDTLSGGRGKDALDGGDGNDTVEGGGGADVIYASLGNDDLNGGWGRDKLRVDFTAWDAQSLALVWDMTAGVFSFDAVSDASQTRNIEDLRLIGDFDIKVFGDDADNRLRTDLGADTLKGGDGKDVLTSGDGNDRLLGQNGDDKLRGDSGDDVLRGGGGNDILEGGAGTDKMAGGRGRDTFVFGEGFGADVIVDFDASDDGEKIDLSAVAAILGFEDLTENHLDEDGGNTTIDAGDGNTITLRGVLLTDLDANDFLF